MLTKKKKKKTQIFAEDRRTVQSAINYYNDKTHQLC